MKCYMQVCDMSEVSCGSLKLKQLFADVLKTLGTKQIDYFQHICSSYEKTDGTKVQIDYFSHFSLTCIHISGPKMGTFGAAL